MCIRDRPDIKVYAGAQALCDIVQAEPIDMVLASMVEMCIRDSDDLVIPEQKHYVSDSFIDGTIMTLADAPWPGLTPDLLAVLLLAVSYTHLPLKSPLKWRF